MSRENFANVKQGFCLSKSQRVCGGEKKKKKVVKCGKKTTINQQ